MKEVNNNLALEEVCYHPIGIIRSPFREPKDVPIQASAARGIRGTVEIFPEFEEGLKDIEGFSHLILVYHFHRARFRSLLVRPYMDENYHGVFATRAPARPNPIGISIVRLVKRRGNVLIVEDVDILDGTPLLDIKPYVPDFDHRDGVKTGWLEENVHKLPKAKDDGRFAK
ncbi:tRNA (N6-threonylcarbamoyladenosine(37)-N6)-methyltransferase TrmO [Thermococcus alcaliphilus]|uniref:tRNA (N6-threonylcarbamoyladenosine(37)-N6)-methyltransferase TrmO n=1 Tax=Thermococcus alcaliphilus TaxID=139207 RepID=UPI00208FFF4A|nr:tRNA (N6-threonylcarbamoyladenosine(37)-N6)-methyltransferase TrmO [Thermococcus alcaliphilus]MCO6041410.1 tRNA (N6-threonylcarbamoyladenosine(37)-N6)-methyltransferase TrmO [Thermococcus alcaliphilus]